MIQDESYLFNNRGQLQSESRFQNNQVGVNKLA